MTFTLSTMVAVAAIGGFDLVRASARRDGQGPLTAGLLGLAWAAAFMTVLGPMIPGASP